MKLILPKPVIRIERWKYSRLFGVYVSNLGNFRDKEKNPIKPLVGENGYLTIKLKHGYMSAHRIVAATWLPQEDMFHLTVDHLDHNKRNNAVYNLEWVTKKENLTRAVADLVPSVTVTTPAPITGIKMFTDANYQHCIKEFSSSQEVAVYLKANISTFKGDDKVTVETITKKIAAFKDKHTYCGYYWQVVHTCNN